MRGSRHLAAGVALLAGLLIATGAAGAKRSWAQPEIQEVVANGLMAPSVETFRPDDPLVGAELAQLLPSLAPVDDGTGTTTTTSTTTTTTDPMTPAVTTTDTTTTAPATTTTAPVATPTPGFAEAAPITLAQLDTSLVRTLRVGDAATRFARATRAVGLKPPARFGTEVVARLLGLRTNHPASQDSLELRPGDAITRAETAYSVAQILAFRGWELQSVEDASKAFALPALDPWQLQILQTAIQLIGYPYVWGGTSPGPEAPFGHQARGGFDCSGFVWRVYKLHAYANEGTLAGTLRGRTTFQMSGEVPKAQRIAIDALQPADVLFFGAAGPLSKPKQVNHTAIYLGNGWFIQSSGYGVALAQLDGWYAKRFAWARRPLAEAGLAG
jgi:cell wall-associated NlpC family hydrolase